MSPTGQMEGPSMPVMFSVRNILHIFNIIANYKKCTGVYARKIYNFHIFNIVSVCKWNSVQVQPIVSQCSVRRLWRVQQLCCFNQCRGIEIGKRSNYPQYRYILLHMQPLRPLQLRHENCCHCCVIYRIWKDEIVPNCCFFFISFNLICCFLNKLFFCFIASSKKSNSNQN